MRTIRNFIYDLIHGKQNEDENNMQEHDKYIKDIEENGYMYSDGIGGYLYINKSEDCCNSVDLLMEVEDEDKYNELLISLHKEDIKILIENLKQIIEDME